MQAPAELPSPEIPEGWDPDGDWRAPPSPGSTWREQVLATFRPTDPAGWQLLSMICATIDELAKMEHDVAREGTTITGARGQPIAHPAMAVIQRHRQLLARLFSDLFPPPKGKETESQKAARAARARWNRG